MKIALVIPVFNEVNYINTFFKEWSNETRKYKFIFHFVFINDGSTDGSLNRLRQLKKKNITIINQKNSGHGTACLNGYKYCIKNKFKYIMQIDSDGQCDPKFLNQFLILAKKKKFVIGNRRKREDGYLRRVISIFLSLFIFLKKFIYVKDSNTPYRIYNYLILKKIIKLKKLDNIILINSFITYYICKIYPKEVRWVNIIFRKRVFGKTSYSFQSLFKSFLNLIIKI